MDYQDEVERLRREMQGRPSREEMEQTAAERGREWEGKMEEVRQSSRQLQEQADSLLLQLQTSKEEKQALLTQLSERDGQMEALERVLAEKDMQETSLLERVGVLEEELKEREYLALNERNLLQDQSAKMHEKKASLEQYEFILDLKSKEVVTKYEEL